MHCTKCDTVNPATARFCTFCGATLTPLPETPAVYQTMPLPPSDIPSNPADPTVTYAPIAPVTPQPMAAPAPLTPPAPAPTVNVNVTVQAPISAPVAAPTPIIVVNQNDNSGPGCLVRTVYFLFIGLWFGALWTSVAWFALVTVVGIPIGLMMLNRLPQVMTLKPVRRQTQVTVNGGVVVVSQGSLQQHPFLTRALYFVFIGWWFSGLWLAIAWSLIGVTFGLALPISFWMFDRTPAIVTLAKQ